jgi:putative tricarboxylic transport membrane protein
MSDRLLAICAIVGALIYLFADSRIPDPVISDPLGPKVFPMLIGIGLLISGVLILIESLKKNGLPAKPAETSTVNQKDLGIILVAMVIWTIVYYTAFEPVGYIISTVVYLFGLLLFFHPKKHVKNALISVIFTAVAYATFAKFLGVSMPAGLLAF